jgi:Asp-tRNA(Asn)/Glu-tRNA(Gln) amidotransferase A subunit family amidase
MTSSIGRLGVCEAAALIAAGKLSCVELTEACLARIAARESIVHAWEYIDPDAALAQARMRDGAARRGPLHGIPIGIKDIIDTAAMPTAYGSPIYRGFRPARNAACVERLLESGAVILGKTVTTELANRFPGKTANPVNPRHTPGGSSSGSAAAVADFMVPAALGTQTTGSVIRPAAYCGIFGYKPSFGAFDTAGVKQLSPSLDTLGLMSRSVADIERVASVLAGRPLQSLDQFDRTAPRVAVCRTPAWPWVEQASRDALDNAVALLERTGTSLEKNWDRDGELAGLIEAQKTIMAVETARSLAPEYREQREHLSASLQALVEYGIGQHEQTYADALTLAGAARAQIQRIFGEFDAIITPSSAGEAPAGLDNTGEPVFNAIWTLVHAPCVTVPLMTAASGLPVGVQIVGRPGEDGKTLAVAQWLAASNV